MTATITLTDEKPDCDHDVVWKLARRLKDEANMAAGSVKATCDCGVVVGLAWGTGRDWMMREKEPTP